MLLSSTSFELDDLDQGDHDSLDSWVHHLLLAVDHVSMPLFSAFFLLLHLFFFDVRCEPRTLSVSPPANRKA